MFVLMHLLALGGAFTTTCEFNSSRHTPCAAESPITVTTDEVPFTYARSWEELKAQRAAHKKQAEHP